MTGRKDRTGCNNMKHVMRKILCFIQGFMLWMPSYFALAQVGPFTGVADINMGSAQNVTAQTQISVPVNIDLTAVSGFDADALPVTETLGQYRFAISYDGSLLEPVLSNGQIPGGTSLAFTDPVVANVQLDANLSYVLIHASQVTSNTTSGLLNVASIPFLVKGEVGSTANVTLTTFDLRTPLSVIATPDTAVIGGESLNFAVTQAQININAVNTAANDADGDGLPDVWELANGLSPANPADATVDSDGDSFNVLQEYLAATNVNNINDAPQGFAGLSYVLFRDDFADNQYDDRWSIVSETPLSVFSFNEVGGQLNATLQQPTLACNHIKLASLASVDVANAVLQTTLDMPAKGLVKIGLQPYQTLSHRLEVHIDSDLQTAVLQSWENNILTEQTFALTAQDFLSPVNIRLVKNGTDYELYINDLTAAALPNVSLGSNQLQAFFDIESCQVDSGDLNLVVDLLEILLDQDADGLADAIEDPNSNGVVDTGETDPLAADSDSDGLTDGQEDINRNGIVDIGETDPVNADSDGDGFDDGVEVSSGSDPLDGLSTPSINGDVNGDGQVDTADVLTITRIAIGLLTPTAEQTLSGDVAPLVAGLPSPDGEINAADVLVITRKALGLIDF